MTGDHWDKYVRTGVIHVLAISGQHLVILAVFLWVALRVLGVPRRRGAILVMAIILAYALLVGARPPVLRAAVMVCAFCCGLLLRRPVVQANAFALAWLIVVLLDPTDVFNSGCQLSFLSVAVFHWARRRFGETDTDQLARLKEKNRPGWEKRLRRCGRQMVHSYLITIAIWFAIAPLVAAKFHVVSPVCLVIGPVMILLTSVALVMGFLLLFFAPINWQLAQLVAWPTQMSLAACETLVSASESWPAAFGYVSDIPNWWLWVFYVGLFAFLTVNLVRAHWQWIVLAALGWLCVGLVHDSMRRIPGEFRCTFLGVGHGGCAVIETPDGRTLLYDAGSMQGPDVTRRHIAPFLWQRGIRRIDEVLVSHADLDHFNGLPALLHRFAIGQVTTTPSFSERTSPGVERTLLDLEHQRIPIRIAQAGDRLQSGSTTIDVLHPPAGVSSGNENSRSMVILIQHEGFRILLTGDLEGAGLERVLSLTSQPVDVLMAPHHGSKNADPTRLARWARPKIVIACLGHANNSSVTEQHYEHQGARFLATWPHGAITIRAQSDGLAIDTFGTRERWLLAKSDRR